jgi:tetratricopeptide (TPR) repeat protein
LPLDRGAAEVWLLLGRHPGNEDLLEWAAWFFDHQRQYGELALLIKAADRERTQGRVFSRPWLDLRQGLSLMRESRLEEAMELLRPLAGENWEAAANLGRIMESRRSPTAALEYYELAARGAKTKEDASRIQFRMSRCYKSLGQEGESLRALEYALELNPDNLNARLELRRPAQ